MKKLIATLLALCMVVSLAPAVLAAGDDSNVRETSFFSDQPHEDTNFEDMAYIPVTEEQFLAAIDDVEALIEADASVQEIEDSFHVVTDLMQALESDLTLLNIKTSIDVTDQESLDLYLSTYDLYLACYDPFIFLIQDILGSKAAEKIISDDLLTQSDIDYYVNYGGMSDEEAALSSQIAALDSMYDQASNSGDFQGMCDAYMKSIELNKALAALYPEYDSYADYAYENVFGRDYSLEEAEAFFTAVKEYIVPLASQLYYIEQYDVMMAPDVARELFYNDYTTGETLDLVRPYIGRISSELLETWDYMVEHGLYDIEARETKYDGGFTTQIPSYGAPFFFNSPGGDFYDFTTIVHEFGHYSNYYWHPHIWNEGSCSYDVAEVHSQALELLFSGFYGEIFGDAANIAQDDLFNNMISNGILNGCLIAELELYAYTTDDVTLDMINEKFIELCKEYGFEPLGDYVFVTIPHMTQSPLYYISYATSDIGALTFWNISQEEGFEAAIDKYLKFMAHPYYDTFQQEFIDVCNVNPMDPAYIAEITENVAEALSVTDRFRDVERMNYFDDVAMGTWYYEDVCLAVELGLMNGRGGDMFAPDSKATRAEAVTVLWNLFENEEPESKDNFADVTTQWYADAANWAGENDIVQGVYGSFNGNANVSREQVAVMICNAAEAMGLDTSVSGTTLTFTDADKIDIWALDEMTWCVEQGFFSGNGNMIYPTAAIRRAELAKVMVAFAELVSAE